MANRSSLADARKGSDARGRSPAARQRAAFVPGPRTGTGSTSVQSSFHWQVNVGDETITCAQSRDRWTARMLGERERPRGRRENKRQK
eukprot:2177654-Rhodomonas_salina.2